MKEIRIGCSGYFYFHWKGKFYPYDIEPKDFLKYYQQFFNTVEINSTFYNMPNKSSLKRLIKETSSDFKISVKMNKQITHVKRFNEVSEDLKIFYDGIKVLENRLAYVLIQLPPSIKYDVSFLNLLLATLEPYTKEFDHAVEFRHESWWNKEVYDMIEQHNFVFVSVDSSKVPDDIVVSNKRIYLRLHGRGAKYYDYFYSNKELQDIAEKLKRSDATNIYVYFNNDYNAYAPKNALMLKKLLNLI